MKEAARRLFAGVFLLIISVAFALQSSVSFAEEMSVGKARFSAVVKTGATQVKLSWTEVENASGYTIFMQKGKSKPKTIATITTGASGSYTVKKLKKKGVYTFSIQAFHKNGNSVVKGALSQKEKIDLRNPIIPALKKAVVKNGSVNLSWSKSKDAKGYIIYRKTGASGRYQKLKKIKKKSVLKYTDKKVSAGNTYYYRIEAISGKRKSGQSNEVYAVVPGTSVKNFQESSNVDDLAQALSDLVKKNKTKNGASIQAENEYYSGRLIVKSDGKDLDFSSCNPTAVVKGVDHIYFVQFANSEEARLALGEISSWKGVVFVEPDSCGVTSVETSGEKAKSWGVDHIGANRLAKVVTQSKNTQIKVAVVDSGVSNHSYLGNRITNDGYDMVDNDRSPADLHGHGTHVAGIVIGCTPGTRITVMPVRVLDANGIGFTSVIGIGIRYAVDHGAKIINLSLGGSIDGAHQYMDECIDYAVRKGVTVVVAAGNEYGNTDRFCPAHLSSVICVGAVNRNNVRADFSNVGKAVDVVAPGVEVTSCIPGGRYATWNGTSMAAPHIAALAAMLKALYPSYTPAQIETAIKNNCKDLGASGRDNYYGYGIPNFTSFRSPTSVTLNKTSLTLTEKQSATLTATIRPSDALEKTVTWSSNNAAVATVSNGTVTGKKAGTAVITAKTSNGKAATCTVTVKASDELKINVTSCEVFFDGFEQAYGSNNYVDRATRGVKGTFSFSRKLTDEEFKSPHWVVIPVDGPIVDSSGKRIKGAGAIRVTSQSGGYYYCAFPAGGLATGKYTLELSVEVGKKYRRLSTDFIMPKMQTVEATDIKFNVYTNQISLAVGKSIPLVPIVMPTNVTDRSVAVTSDNINIVKVESRFDYERGIYLNTLTGVGVGKANVTAKTSNGKTVSIAVEVNTPINLEITSLEVRGDSYPTGVKGQFKMSRPLTDFEKTYFYYDVSMKDKNGDEVLYSAKSLSIDKESGEFTSAFPDGIESGEYSCVIYLGQVCECDKISCNMTKYDHGFDGVTKYYRFWWLGAEKAVSFKIQ